MELVWAYFHTMGSQNSPIEDSDRMRWCLGSKGDFDIQSFYGALRGSNSVTFPWKRICGIKALRRMSFSIWKAVWGKILIDDYLRRRGFAIMDCCGLCQCSGRGE